MGNTVQQVARMRLSPMCTRSCDGGEDRRPQGLFIVCFHCLGNLRCHSLLCSRRYPPSQPVEDGVPWGWCALH